MVQVLVESIGDDKTILLWLLILFIIITITLFWMAMGGRGWNKK